MTWILTMLMTARLALDVRRERSERGSVTIEHVLWAVAVIAIVAIVVAAVRAYVTTQAGNIQ
jgi:heme/copper-type cytochrome/quinol oxidase subunit 2